MQVLICAENRRLKVIHTVIGERNNRRRATQRSDGVLVVSNKRILVKHMPGGLLSEISDVIVVTKRDAPLVLSFSTEYRRIFHHKLPIRHNMLKGIFRIGLCPEHVQDVHRGISSSDSGDGFQRGENMHCRVPTARHLRHYLGR